MAIERIAFTVFLLTKLMLVDVNADYDIFVRVHNFTSPASDKCSVCCYDSLQPFGCCSRFDEVDECSEEDIICYGTVFLDTPCNSTTSLLSPTLYARCTGSLDGVQIRLVGYRVGTDDDVYLSNFIINVADGQVPIGVETGPHRFSSVQGNETAWLVLSIRIECYYNDSSCNVNENCVCDDTPVTAAVNTSVTATTYAATPDFQPNLAVVVSTPVTLVLIILLVIVLIFIALLKRKRIHKTTTYHSPLATQGSTSLAVAVAQETVVPRYTTLFLRTSTTSSPDHTTPSIELQKFSGLELCNHKPYSLKSSSTVVHDYTTHEATPEVMVVSGVGIDTYMLIKAEQFLNNHLETQFEYPGVPEVDSSVNGETLFDVDTNYIDHEVKKFDSSGGVCEFENCTLTIPKDSIPQDKVIHIEIGVTICSKLTSLLPRDVTPVSPIIQLCVVNEPTFKFTKPVTIQILHCLDISSEEDVKQMDLHFLKSQHNLPCFHTTDGEEDFPANTHHGTLTINHFCSFCIAAGKNTFNNPSKVYYSVISIAPRQIITPKWEIVYCIALYTCCRIIENQYSSTEFTIKRVKLFKFSSKIERDPYIELDFTRHPEGGWYLALLTGPKIEAYEIDYVEIEPEVLNDMEKDKLYPPRYTININGVSAHKPATLILKFGGSLNEFTSEVILEQNQDYNKQQETMPPPDKATTQSLPNLPELRKIVTSDVQLPLELSNTNEEFQTAPTHRALMNHIAVNIPTKWRDIGVQLGLRVADLDAIEGHHYSDYKRCFSDVFNLWEQQLTPPYLWSTILEALTSPLLGELRLAQETRHILSQSASSSSSGSRRSSSRMTDSSEEN